MKFDLFEAMRIMRTNFGETAGIDLRTECIGVHEYGIRTRLSVRPNGEFCNVSFIVSDIENESTISVDIFRMRFANAIIELNEFIEENNGTK